TILDYDETPESRDLAEQMIRSGYFQLIRWARNQHDVDRDLTTDASKAAVIIPVDFSARIRSGEPVTVQAIIDGSDSNTATIAQGYLLGMISGYAANLPRAVQSQAGLSSQATDRRLPASETPSAEPGIELESRVWYNPALKSVNFIVPGVIAVIMMIVGAI